MTDSTPGNRIAPIVAADANPQQADVIARLGAGRGRIPTPFHIWLHSPRLADGMERVGTYLNNDTILTEAELEIVILATAVFWKSPYVITNHLRHAVNAGVPEAAVESIHAGLRPVLADARMQMVADMTADLLAGGGVAAEQFDAYAAAFGRDGIAEIIALVGYYTSVSLGLRFHEV